MKCTSCTSQHIKRHKERTFHKKVPITFARRPYDRAHRADITHALHVWRRRPIKGGTRDAAGTRGLPKLFKGLTGLPLTHSRLSLVQLLVFVTPTDLVLACYYWRRAALQCGMDKGTLRNDF